MILNKNLLNISMKEWHSIMQQVHVKELQRLGVEVITEKRLMLPNGHKKYRIADIYIPALSLVIEVQKSKFVPKEFRERNEDYKSLGLRVIWILNNERWEPDTMGNPELENESDDICIKWRPYSEGLSSQFIYNSNRYFIIDYWKTNSVIDIYYCLPTSDGLMYRKLESVDKVERELTPKFPEEKHFRSASFANHNQPKEIFEGYKIKTSISTNQTIPMDFIR